MLESLNVWVLGLGAEYGVNPYIFAVIYIGAIPFFLGSIGWLVRNARAVRSTVLPAMSAGFFFISAYLYLGIFGHDIPVWVWGFVGSLLGFGSASAIRDTKRKIASGRSPHSISPSR
ncbi:hypothetical protein KCG45_12100 [Erythrobacter sp. WH131]|uniref:Uncharacterized protein n=2 Tax=Erythrobacter ani TaxID=2827235 RepID=A0ABS6SPL2_9SPHN|nr:hypothetical protein [Erythrobacter ani]